MKATVAPTIAAFWRTVAACSPPLLLALRSRFPTLALTTLFQLHLLAIEIGIDSKLKVACRGATAAVRFVV